MIRPPPRILFIFPRWPNETLWGHFHYKFPCLGLLTIAGATPHDCQIDFIDENLSPIPFDSPADIVALSVMTPLAHRAYEIADRFRALGKTVVLGGIHPSCEPDEALEHADAVIVGEGEASWRTFLDDFRAGAPGRLYRADAFPDLRGVPIARRDLLDRRRYLTRSFIQLTRGCPFDCEYCTVTAFFGRRFRSRPLDEFADEYLSLPDRFVFIVDDNIVSNRAAALRLFERIRGSGKWWGGQAPISIADDDEVLSAMAASGCKALFIGLESLNEDNLAQMGKKFVRLGKNAERIRKIQDRGIGIQGSFIVGYDFDTPAVFDQLHDFITRTRLEAFLISILTPFPGTKVTRRLEAEDRILTRDWRLYDMNTAVFKPRHFTPDDLQSGYYALNKALHAPSNILRRTLNLKKNMVIFVPQNFGFRAAWNGLFEARHVF